MAAHNDLGSWGEEKAAEYLKAKGYTILERDWRSGRRDIDIIALNEDGTEVVFVEVKTRASRELAAPEDAVGPAKVRSIGCAADAFVKERGVEEAIRFDVVAVVGSCGGDAEVEHTEYAFNPLLV